MAEITRTALFGKLNPLAYKADRRRHRVLQAARQPVRRAAALAAPDPATRRTPTCTASSSTTASTPSALASRPDGVRSTACRAARSSITDLSSFVENAVERGWVYGSLMFGDTQVRTGYLLVGMLKTPSLRNALLAISQAVRTRQARRPADNFATLLARLARSRASAPATAAAAPAQPGEASGAIAPAAMGKQEALKRFTVDLTERARNGEIDPIVGPRRRDPPDRRHPDAPAPEQPDPHRRGRRRQDRGGRRLRAAHRARRRAAAAEGRGAARARHRPAAGRRQHEGRVREPPALRSSTRCRRRQADHPVHRRGAHADRRRRRGRHRRRGQPAQAGAGARQAAHHRRHHLGRVQEAHREGPGADAALPGRAGRRAERGEGRS